MQFYEIVARGHQDTGLVINTWWYRREVLTGPPVNADLANLLAGWQTFMQPKYLAVMVNNYRLDQVDCYGYNDTFERAPFLPVSSPPDLPGTGSPGVVNPFAVAIFSCRLEPVRAGRHKDKTGAIVTRPVRRGYLAIGPLLSGWVVSSGRVEPTMRTSLPWLTLRDALAANIADPSAGGAPFIPVRVSKPLPKETARGYGDVKGAVIREFASTRRSRMAGRGA